MTNTERSKPLFSLISHYPPEKTALKRCTKMKWKNLIPLAQVPRRFSLRLQQIAPKKTPLQPFPSSSSSPTSFPRHLMLFQRHPLPSFFVSILSYLKIRLFQIWILWHVLPEVLVKHHSLVGIVFLIQISTKRLFQKKKELNEILFSIIRELGANFERRKRIPNCPRKSKSGDSTSDLISRSFANAFAVFFNF